MKVCDRSRPFVSTNVMAHAPEDSTAQRPMCFRCAGIMLRVVSSHGATTFLECPSCHRPYTQAPSGPLVYRWRHPITVALYGVVFDVFPEARAAAEAEQFLSRTTLRGLHDMVDEIDLELNAPPVSGERLPG